MSKKYPPDTWVDRRRQLEPTVGDEFTKQEGYRPYNFTITYPDIRALIMTIGTLGEDIVGVELGLYRGDSFCTLLQCCPNIKKLYGVDAWVPYEDYIGTDGTRAGKTTNIQEMELARGMAYHFLRHSGKADRATVLEMDTSEAVKEFEDDSLDFVFLDAYLSEEQCARELREWWPKVKTGGLFSGHDWNDRGVRDQVRKFRETLDEPRSLITYDSTWAFIK